MTPIQLPPLAVIRSTILAALNANELQAQHAPPGRSIRCTYAGPCAIGVVLTPEERTMLDKAPWCSIGALVGDNYVKLHEDTTVEQLETLQRAHDTLDLDGLRDLVTPIIRWRATITYRHDAGPEEVTREFEELEELHDYVEAGPHWDTIIKIEIVRINHNDSPTLTVEQAAEL